MSLVTHEEITELIKKLEQATQFMYAAREALGTDLESWETPGNYGRATVCVEQFKEMMNVHVLRFYASDFTEAEAQARINAIADDARASVNRKDEG